VNTIGPRVNLTPGSISVAVDRLFDKGLVRRVESAEDRRVRVVSLTPKGKELIIPVFANTLPKLGKSLPTRVRKNCEVLKQY
jgi:DNA-binding MarR family transcriptional regulator